MTNQNIVPQNAEDNLPASYGEGEQLRVETSLAISLARAEIDQQVATARALPRSIQRALDRITELATLDEETARECIYSLPRGGKDIRGPSIRFAEIMATQWGNCRVGSRIIHVDRIEGYVEAEGVFHDVESNVIQTVRIQRPIQRKKGKSSFDSDMIQLAGAAAASIARRNAIFAGIPKGVGRRAYLAVEDVIRGDVKTLVKRRFAALKAFADMGVASERVFAALGVAGEDDITLDHLVDMTGTRSALKSGETTLEEAFPPIKPANGDRPKDLGDAMDKMASAASTGDTVDPDTGEITEGKAKSKQVDPVVTSGKPAEPSTRSADVKEGAGKAAADSTPSEAAAKGKAIRADLDRRIEADAKAASVATDGPSAEDAAILADLMETGSERAQAGEKALRQFLDEDCTDDERKLIPPNVVGGWIKAARAKDKRK